MAEIAVFAVILVVTFLGGIWLGQIIMKRLMSRQPPKVDVCTGDYCQAFRWDYCTGGRCKYHCGVYCHCGLGEDALKAIARAKR